MNPDKDTEFVIRTREQLDRHAEQLDEATASRLRVARRQALEGGTQRTYRWLP
jgi:hypothetical protein